MKENEERTLTISFKASPKEKAKLEELCKEESRSMSSLIRSRVLTQKK